MKVDECFGPTVQGEGAQAGAVTMFVRLGGCDYRCSWCDTMHAVDPDNAPRWREMDPDDIAEEVKALVPTHPEGTWVTISGGNPAIWQKELSRLVLALNDKGFRVNIETQGSVPNEAFWYADMVTISPKGPSSGMTLDRDKLKACMNQAGMKAVLKFVVANDQDFAFAVDVASHYPHVDTYVQPITITDKVGHEKRAFPTYRRLCERVATTPALSHWRVIPQLHVLAWGGERGR